MNDQPRMPRAPILECLDDGWIAKLKSVWVPIRFQPQETVVDFDDASADVYLIATGQVRAILRVAVGKEIILGELGPGQLFGELAALDGKPRSASLTALVQTDVFRIPEPVFRQMLEESPRLCRHLLVTLSERTRDLTRRIAELSFLDTRHRLYNTLLRLSRKRTGNDEQRIISPPVIHADLAERIGASREAVSREMSKLAKEGLLERTRGAIILARPDELSRRISSTLQL
ncbi:MAG: Crp/Fnr family transcriptional regulator [Zhengella sp.]|uniref:Crp/Fnr family transcriptional regulator n=1 Tax=Zhengella sp. TaxID=2282762 RepID=UPI001D66CABB|nr:Crp/Fnr family transcriptional regulator [Notoacmeibacter sp.]MCC0027619.1 Crp/Fnr family transcriptional regulator [Brucellaceae bacterium]